MRTRDKDDQRVTVFFTDQKQFMNSLAEATGGARPEGTTIQVMMGRSLQVLKYGASKDGKEIMKASFQELCEKNLGSTDYYALCKVANTVYLAGLSQFKEDELDFVRRFITLIDLAYESKTRIVCLSSVPLFELFAKIVASKNTPEPAVQQKLEEMSVRRGGGSSSSMMSTFIGEMEWSATGLPASLASGGAGEVDVKFAIGRAVSRLFEMGSKSYGMND